MNGCWTAIMAYNHGGASKTRLAGALPPADRIELAARMAQHVADVLATQPEIGRALVIAPSDPKLPGLRWVRDKGRGLNGELYAAWEASSSSPVLFVHADLPMLGIADVTVLLQAAESKGVAIAPDVTGSGTNGLAFARGEPQQLSFGSDSFAQHCTSFSEHVVVRTTGWSIDIDVPEDMMLAGVLGADLTYGGALPRPKGKVGNSL
jgi:2-phospho-L-lactate/phosphoenolpyruvate guanylyltransferase